MSTRMSINPRASISSRAFMSLEYFQVLQSLQLTSPSPSPFSLASLSFSPQIFPWIRHLQVQKSV
jgi:hypothetical protein